MPAHGEFARYLPRAVFTGHLSGDALGEVLASADVLLTRPLPGGLGRA